MSVYIFAPGAKQFILPCVVLYRWYRRTKSDITIVTNTTNADYYRKLGCIAVTDQIFQELLPDECDEYVFFKHNAVGQFNKFCKVVAHFHASILSKKVKVSFFPDGFGNAMWGKNYISDYCDEEQISKNMIEVINVFSFGFIHTSTLRQYDASVITVVDYSYLTELIENCQFLKDICIQTLINVDQFTSIVLVPFRPWCTDGFHGGVYDFGDQTVLANIYCNLIENHVTTDKKMVFFRGDERFPNESSFVFDELNKSYDCLEIDTVKYPKWLTLEPLLYFMITKFQHISIVNLDSTTFQIVPFLINRLDSHCKVSGLIGCENSILSQNSVPDTFKDSKLKVKIKDFKNRYSTFDFQDNTTLSLNEIDDTFFILTVD